MQEHEGSIVCRVKLFVAWNATIIPNVVGCIARLYRGTMTRARGLQALLAALCFSVAAVGSAAAAGAQADLGHFKSDGTFVAPKQDDSQKSWLVPGQNRIVNPFRATPAPGTGRLQLTPPQARTSGPGTPENAMANATGRGWTCNIGFRRQNDACVAVQIPENATIDLTGHNWMCNRGFRRESEGCVAIVIPANASLGPQGRGWVCHAGFRRQKDQCIAFAVPENASLSPAGNGWVCNTGFQQLGNRCVDDQTAQLQKDTNKVVNATKTGKTAPRPSVRVQSNDTRRGQTGRASVVIGRF